MAFGRDWSEDGIFSFHTRLVGAADGRAVRSRWFNFSHEKCPDDNIIFWHIRLSNYVSLLRYNFPLLAPSLLIEFGDSNKEVRESNQKIDGNE